MSTQQAQIVDPQEFIDILDYEFTGDTDTVNNKRAFINALREQSTAYHAAQHARVSRKTVYRWREVDSQFAEAWDEALEDAGDIMESSVYHRAFKDNLLAMFWLKAHRPKFRDRVSIDVDSVRNEVADRMKALQLAPAGMAGLVPQFRDESERKQKESEVVSNDPHHRPR